MSANDPFSLLTQLKTHMVNHSGGTLYEHLVGTYKLLKERGSEEYVCLAGLYHSIYGTQFFKYQTTHDRDTIKATIGEDAENLVWLFCNVDRNKIWDSFEQNNFCLLNGDTVDMSDQEFNDLYEIIKANRDEQSNRKAVDRNR